MLTQKMIRTSTQKFVKVLRFIGIYGFGRTLFKALGRLRLGIELFTFNQGPRCIGIVGCGQFAFATIGYFVLRYSRRRFLGCYDVNLAAQKSFEKAYGIPETIDCFEKLISHRQLELLYIASNHASHSTYAIEALRRGIQVYIEKPIAVSHSQLVGLVAAQVRSSVNIFAGYNRPFSAAIIDLRQVMPISPAAGISIQCFVAGHMIDGNHWYRNPAEGTRVCGNLGHWLDLFIHILCWRGLPDALEIHIIAANENEPDDNLVLSIRTDRSDIFSLMLTSRCEPFEGINESINIQHGQTTCKIDDFRRMTIWQNSHVIKRHYWPKDVGHRLAICQPFDCSIERNWDEVVLSTLLMLHIAEMVGSSCTNSKFSFLDSQRTLNSVVKSIVTSA